MALLRDSTAWRPLVAVVAAATALANGGPNAEAAGVRPLELGKMRGVCWEAGRAVEPRHLAPLRALGVDWISQTPFGWSPSPRDPRVVLAPEHVHWGETDSGLVYTARWARELGIRTLLKPHLWVRGGWVGDVRMQTEAEWRAWFADYEQFILHYARLAEAHGFDALAVGTELGGTTDRTADWLRLVERVRQTYRGPITYCANWHDEAERIEFWSALDFIGVQAYYPLGAGMQPPADSMRAAWRPVVERLGRLARRTGKPIVFTEVGYKSAAGAVRAPWSWDAAGDRDLEQQRDAYRVLFETWWDVPWFGGTFLWKWHPQLLDGYGRRERDFTPQGKPALEVVRAWYGFTGRSRSEPRGSAGGAHPGPDR
jgi:hypothetical protein